MKLVFSSTNAVPPQPDNNSSTLMYWTASLILIGLLLLGDAAVVSLSAGVATTGEVIAGFLTYALISGGIIVTEYIMKAY